MIKLFTKILAIIVLVTGMAFAEENFTEVSASHILVRTAAEALQIKKDIEEGGSFEYYAQKYSLCPSGRNGGNLGYFGRGQMVPEFERKAFSLPVGEVSDPIHTDFGWHLIRVNERR
ncbi:MAG: peptidyl-prolyl cis-trans isomerase [Brachyspira sp.]|nr:peptidyl-prolyl cis-trans isomerase [Brachyspira sp.]CCY24933.1 peptidil-prolyl cis-trans isomerase [Brachyspira sp. CAG:484]